MHKGNSYTINFESVKFLIAHKSISIKAENYDEAHKEALKMRDSLRFESSEYRDHIQSVTGVVDICCKDKFIKKQ